AQLHPRRRHHRFGRNVVQRGPGAYGSGSKERGGLYYSRRAVGWSGGSSGQLRPDRAGHHRYDHADRRRARFGPHPVADRRSADRRSCPPHRRRKQRQLAVRLSCRSREDAMRWQAANIAIPALVLLTGCDQEAGQSAADPVGLAIFEPAIGSNDVLHETLSAAPGHELIVADLRLGPDAVGEPHSHPWEEYLYVLGGSAVLDVEGAE